MGWSWDWLEGPALPGLNNLCPTPIQPEQPGCQCQHGLARSSSDLPLSPLLHPWPVSPLRVQA